MWSRQKPFSSSLLFPSSVDVNANANNIHNNSSSSNNSNNNNNNNNNNARLVEAKETINNLLQAYSHLERKVDKSKEVIDDARSQLNRVEERFSKSQAEMLHVQQQLESMKGNLEKEHGVVSNHSEQLRLFARERDRRRGADGSTEGHRSLLRVLGNWLNTPLVNFIKGVYTLLSPFVHTFQSLSLITPDVLERHMDEYERSRWTDAKKGDLLGMLQSGALDPTSIFSSKSTTSQTS